MNFYPLPKFYGTSWAWRRAKRSAFFHQETHPAQYKRRWAKTTRSKSPGATWPWQKENVKIEKSWIFNGILWWLMGFNGIWPMKKWGSQNQHSWSQALFFSHWVLTCFARHKCNNQALRSLLIGTKDIPRSMLNVGTWKPHELNVEILQSIEIPHTQFVFIILGLEIQNLMCEISGTIGRCFPLYPSYHHLSRRSWNPPSKSSPKCSQTLDAPGWIPHSSNQKIK